MLTNLTQISTFIAVAETGSFRAAADRLFVSPPAVSARIQQLERSLGLQVLNRTTRSVTLTPEGRRLLVAATHALAELNRVTDQLRDEAALGSGSVNIATMVSLASTIFPPLLIDFREAQPGLTVNLIDVTSDVAIDLLLQGRCDIAVTSRVPLGRGLAYDPLFREECFAVVARDHRLASQRQVDLQQLSKIPILVHPKGSAFRTLLDQILAATGFRFELREANSTATLVALAEGGHGVTFLTQAYLPKLDPNRCKVLRLKSGFLWRDIGIITVENRAQSPAATALHAFLKKRLTDKALFKAAAPINRKR